MTREDHERLVVALDFLLGWAGGVSPLEVVNGHTETLWHHYGPQSGRELARLVRSLEDRYSPDMRLGLPRAHPDAGGVNGATVLWAVIEGTKQTRFAAAFRPLPTMALRVNGSSRRVLLWALRDRADYFDARQANRRLAYRFRAVQKHGDPDELMLPVPGTFVRAGRSRPAAVIVSRCSGDNYTVKQIVGRLKDPPERELGEILAKR